MEEFNFEYNFENMDLAKLNQTDKITPDEIISVFENPSSRQRESGNSNRLTETVFIRIAYSSKKRILLIAFTFANETIDFIGVKVAEETEIDSFYCKG